MRPQIVLVAILAFLNCFFSNTILGQIYHYETGKILPVNEPNKIIWNTGVFQGYAAEYGTLVVKENRNDRKNQLINLPVIKIPALSPDSILPPVFLLHGGPGESNIQMLLLFPELVKTHDIILIGYRGVDGSVKLQSDPMRRALLNDTLTIENAPQLFAAAFDTTLLNFQNQKIDIKGFTINEVVDDIALVRCLLGYPKIILLGYSYGTMISQAYYKRYPSDIDKMVFIGARPINKYLFEAQLYNEQIISFFRKQQEGSMLSDDSVLFLTKHIVDNVLFMNPELNRFRFYFFTFSRLYSNETAKPFFEAFYQAYKGNSLNLLRQYHEFYANFLSGIVLGDIWIKKQMCVNFTESTLKNTIGDEVTDAINNWYTPELQLLQALDNCNTVQFSKKVPVLFISGSNDVASPKQYWSWFEEHGADRASFKEVKDAGHQDLLIGSKAITWNFIEVFLGSN